MRGRYCKPLMLACFALSASFLAACSTNNSEVTKELKYVDGSLTKLTYKVGETLDLSSLEVKLFTTTDGVTDEGVNYTNFVTSVKDGYTFKESDITEEGEYFVVNINALDEGIKSTSINLTVTSADEVFQYIDYTKNDTFKTSYEVGDALSFDGLEIKLYTSTNGVIDSGVAYTTYTTNYDEGYIFTDDDVTNEVEFFNLVVIPEDTSISSLTIELTVLPKEEEFVEVKTTPAEFIQKLIDNMTYTVTNEMYKGTITPNANYWEFLGSDGLSYGYAQNDSEIIRYSIEKGNIKKEYSASRETYASMYAEDFITDVCNDAVMPNATAYTFPDASMKDLEKLTRKENTNDYVFDMSKGHNLVALISPSQIPNDPYLDLIYGKDSQLILTMVDDDTMRIYVSGASSMGALPIDTTIHFDPEVTIPEVSGFLNNTESTAGVETAKKIKEKLLLDNFTSTTVVGEDTYKVVMTKDYYYTDNPNATYTNDIKIGTNKLELDEGNYAFTLDNNNKFTLGDMYENDGEVAYERKLLSINSLVTGFENEFMYDKTNDAYFCTLDSGDFSNYYTVAPNLYALITGNKKPYKLTEINISYNLENDDVKSLIVKFYDGESLLATSTVSNFGSSSVTAIEEYLDSINA